MKSRAHGIVWLARTPGPLWQTFFDTCYLLGSQGDVTILGLGQPQLHARTGQRIRAIEATITHPQGDHARARFHIGVKDDAVFTGYYDPWFRDYYHLTLASGEAIAGKVWWSTGAGPMQQAWHALAPLKMAIWWATYARLLDGRPIVGS